MSRKHRRSAAALVYDAQGSDPAPRVVAKGYGMLAEMIVQRAKEAGLYVHEAPEMVSLLMQVDLDARIPPQLYQAVAELLAWLHRLESGAEDEPRKRRRRRAGRDRCGRYRGCRRRRRGVPRALSAPSEPHHQLQQRVHPLAVRRRDPAARVQPRLRQHRLHLRESHEAFVAVIRAHPARADAAERQAFARQMHQRFVDRHAAGNGFVRDAVDGARCRRRRDTARADEGAR